MKNWHLFGKLIGICGCLLIAMLIPSLIRAQSSDIHLALLAGKTQGLNRISTFDAVSVKVRTLGAPSEETLARPGGYVTLTNVTVRQLIEKAYLPYNAGWSPALNFLLSETLPDWAKSEHFDIEARAAGDPTIAQKQLMLRSMLEDRFKLAIHEETRDLRVLALVLAKPGKTGPQLRHANNTCVDLADPIQTAATGSIPCGVFFVSNGPRDTPGVFIPQASGITMPWFAENLSALVNTLVVDRTGLTGTFDIKFTYSPEPGQFAPPPSNAAMANTAAASIFTALQEQLGLKLEPQTALIGVLVIDHIEQPSPN